MLFHNKMISRSNFCSKRKHHCIFKTYSKLIVAQNILVIGIANSSSLNTRQHMSNRRFYLFLSCYTLWRRLCIRKEETNRLAIWENLDRQGLAIIYLHNHFLVSFKLTDFSKKRAISACWGTIACQQLLRANSQKLKNYFWRRAIIKGQHPHLITYRDLSNFSYHLTTVPLVIFAATLLRMSCKQSPSRKSCFPPMNVPYQVYSHYGLITESHKYLGSLLLQFRPLGHRSYYRPHVKI